MRRSLFAVRYGANRETASIDHLKNWCAYDTAWCGGARRDGVRAAHSTHLSRTTLRRVPSLDKVLRQFFYSFVRQPLTSLRMQLLPPLALLGGPTPFDRVYSPREEDPQDASASATRTPAVVLSAPQTSRLVLAAAYRLTTDHHLSRPVPDSVRRSHRSCLTIAATDSRFSDRALRALDRLRLQLSSSRHAAEAMPQTEATLERFTC